MNADTKIIIEQVNYTTTTLGIAILKKYKNKYPDADYGMLKDIILNALLCEAHSLLVLFDGGTKLSDNNCISVHLNGREVPNSLHEYLDSDRIETMINEYAE